MDRTVCCQIKEPGAEAYEVLNNFRVTQTDMDGLNRLIHWLEGFTAAKSGTIPGYHELVMFYRSIAQDIYQQRSNQAEKQKTDSGDSVVKTRFISPD